MAREDEMVPQSVKTQEILENLLQAVLALHDEVEQLKTQVNALRHEQRAQYTFTHAESGSN